MYIVNVQTALIWNGARALTKHSLFFSRVHSERQQAQQEVLVLRES